jgi:hypothetical protein
MLLMNFPSFVNSASPPEIVPSALEVNVMSILPGIA